MERVVVFVCLEMQL